MTRVERVALLGRARDVEDGTLGAGGAFFGTNTARDGDGDDDGARERARERGGGALRKLLPRALASRRTRGDDRGELGNGALNELPRELT